MGLHPVSRRVWIGPYDVPIAPYNWKFEWSWLAGFVEPSSGQTYWWIVPRANADIFERVLADFAQHFEVSEQQRVVLVIDQARFHTTERIAVPTGIDLLFLPPKSPELQPAERLWPWINEAIANRVFKSLDELEQAIAQRCRALLERTEFIRGLTNFHWWPEALPT